MKDKNKQVHKMKKITQVSTSLLIMILFLLTLASLIYFNKQMNTVDDMDTEFYAQYNNHYVLITDDSQASFWNEVFEGAKERGEETNMYIERFGEDLAVKYSKEDLMKMAIAAKVDGIILEADESEQLRQLIDEAVELNIPVITVMTDCYGSKRQSFIGLGSYDLGREYGRQIVRIATKETKKVLILMDAKTDNIGQNILFTGINETISNEGNHLDLLVETKAVSDTGTFSSEEAIRDIFIDTEQLPDIIICLDEQNTISTYQAVVDYNLVGDVNIIGYYTSETILNAINRKVIASTIAVDSKRIGTSCLDALNEYIATAHVNDFVTLDVSTVTLNNVREYLEDDTETIK